MAKKKSQNTIHTHIPSHIGFGIIALVVLVFGLIVATQYNTGNQTQTVQSQAAGIPAKTTTTTTTKQCIQYVPTYNAKTGKSGETCTLYQSTSTTVPAKSPCISYNTLGGCDYYKGTTQTTAVFTPTPAKKTATQSPPKRGCRTITIGAKSARMCM